ncbi:unnamed protein product [Brassica oleracea]
MQVYPDSFIVYISLHNYFAIFTLNSWTFDFPYFIAPQTAEWCSGICYQYNLYIMDCVLMSCRCHCEATSYIGDNKLKADSNHLKEAKEKT